MAPMTPPQRRAYQAQPRRLQKARARLQHEQARAQRPLQALPHALGDLDLPEILAAEGQGRLTAITTWLEQICGLRCPPRLGCRSDHDRCRVRGWEKHLPGRLLGAWPTRPWVQPWPRRGPALLARWWQPLADNSPAPRRRWPWTWVGDDSLVTKAGPPLGLVGPWESGPEHRVRRGMDGWRLSGVLGEGTRVIPVDCTGRRPDPEGPGRPGRDQLTWRQVRRDRTWAALQRRRLPWPPPLGVADRGCAGAGVLAPGARHVHGTLGVEGTRTAGFARPDKGRVTGEALLRRADWPWRDDLHQPGVREARLKATSPSDGSVTGILVAQPGRGRDDLRCRVTTLSTPRLIRAWGRRSWIAHPCRTRKPVLAPEACQLQGEDADDGPLVWRLLAGLGLLDTARVLGKGQVTREELVFSLTHHWRFLTSKPLE